MSSILVVISGILQISQPSIHDVIESSRYLNGIAVGMVFPMTFIIIGEELDKTLRGLNAVLIDTLSFGCGILIQIMYSVSWTTKAENSFKAIQFLGLLSVTCGILAFIMSSIYTIESPVYYLMRGEEQMANDTLKRLQPANISQQEHAELMQEYKNYVGQHRTRTFLENAVYGFPALLKLCFYRSFVALGFSYFINFSFTHASTVTGPTNLQRYFLYGFARFLGPIIASSIMDSKGRKLSMVVGFSFSTILSFIMAIIFTDNTKYFRLDYMLAVRYLLIFFQLFISMSVSSSSPYLSEAFPLPIKPFYVAIVFIVEMLVHIIVISYRHILPGKLYHLAEYYYALGGLSLAMFLVAIFVMPETKNCSLVKCLPKFRKFWNFSKLL